MIHIQVLTTPAVLEYLLLFRLKYTKNPSATGDRVGF